jgi:hypothetical protein
LETEENPVTLSHRVSTACTQHYFYVVQPRGTNLTTAAKRKKLPHPSEHRKQQQGWRHQTQRGEVGTNERHMHEKRLLLQIRRQRGDH